MQEIEEKQIRKYLGLDDIFDGEQYEQFVQDIIESDLTDWEKHFDTGKGFVYTHLKTKKQQQQHPSIQKYREILMEMLLNIDDFQDLTSLKRKNSNTQLRLEEQKKLRKQQEIRQNQGSKQKGGFQDFIQQIKQKKQNKEVNKNIKNNSNIFQNQNQIQEQELKNSYYNNTRQSGFSPFMKSLKNARNLQKQINLNEENLPQVEVKPLFDQNSKTRQMIQILRNYHDNIFENTDNIIGEIEKYMSHFLGFYQQKYGKVILKIPDEIVQLEEIQKLKIGPYEIVKNLQFLGIQSNEVYLFLFGRLYQFLELPQEWERKFDPVSNQEYFIYNDLEFLIHPCYFYLKNSIKYIKDNKHLIIDATNKKKYYYSFRNELFFDELQRPYYMDISYLLYQLQLLYEGLSESEAHQKMLQYKKKEEEQINFFKERQKQLKKDLQNAKDEKEIEELNYSLKQLNEQIWENPYIEAPKFFIEEDDFDEQNLIPSPMRKKKNLNQKQKLNEQQFEKEQENICISDPQYKKQQYQIQPYDFNKIYNLFGVQKEDLTEYEIINILFYCPFDLESDMTDTKVKENEKPTWKQKINIADIIIKAIRQEAEVNKNKPPSKRMAKLKKFIEKEIFKMNLKKKKIQEQFQQTLNSLVERQLSLQYQNQNQEQEQNQEQNSSQNPNYSKNEKEIQNSNSIMTRMTNLDKTNNNNGQLQKNGVAFLKSQDIQVKFDKSIQLAKQNQHYKSLTNMTKNLMQQTRSNKIRKGSLKVLSLNQIKKREEKKKRITQSRTYQKRYKQNKQQNQVQKENLCLNLSDTCIKNIYESSKYNQKTKTSQIIRNYLLKNPSRRNSLRSFRSISSDVSDSRSVIAKNIKLVALTQQLKHSLLSGNIKKSQFILKNIQMQNNINLQSSSDEGSDFNAYNNKENISQINQNANNKFQSNAYYSQLTDLMQYDLLEKRQRPKRAQSQIIYMDQINLKKQRRYTINVVHKDIIYHNNNQQIKKIKRFKVNEKIFDKELEKSSKQLTDFMIKKQQELQEKQQLNQIQEKQDLENQQANQLNWLEKAKLKHDKIVQMRLKGQVCVEQIEVLDKLSKMTRQYKLEDIINSELERVKRQNKVYENILQNSNKDGNLDILLSTQKSFKLVQFLEPKKEQDGETYSLNENKKKQAGLQNSLKNQFKKQESNSQQQNIQGQKYLQKKVKLEEYLIEQDMKYILEQSYKQQPQNIANSNLSSSQIVKYYKDNYKSHLISQMQQNSQFSLHQQQNKNNLSNVNENQKIQGDQKREFSSQIQFIKQNAQDISKNYQFSIQDMIKDKNYIKNIINDIESQMKNENPILKSFIENQEIMQNQDEQIIHEKCYVDEESKQNNFTNQNKKQSVITMEKTINSINQNQKTDSQFKKGNQMIQLQQHKLQFTPKYNQDSLDNLQNLDNNQLSNHFQNMTRKFSDNSQKDVYNNNNVKEKNPNQKTDKIINKDNQGQKTLIYHVKTDKKEIKSNKKESEKQKNHNENLDAEEDALFWLNDISDNENKQSVQNQQATQYINKSEVQQKSKQKKKQSENLISQNQYDSIDQRQNKQVNENEDPFGDADREYQEKQVNDLEDRPNTMDSIDFKQIKIESPISVYQGLINLHKSQQKSFFKVSGQEQPEYLKSKYKHKQEMEQVLKNLIESYLNNILLPKEQQNKLYETKFSDIMNQRKSQQEKILKQQKQQIKKDDEKQQIENMQNFITEYLQQQKNDDVKTGKVVVLTNGRFAGRKGVVVRANDDGTKDRKFPHALVAGVDRYPRKVIRRHGKKAFQRRTSIKPFIKFVNYNHFMPTRYQVTGELEIKDIAKDAVDPTKKADAKKALRKTLEDKYRKLPTVQKSDKASHLRFFFKKLRF
ncbi:Translation protein SH3-like domain [Pseudocohnilembus persalinus]|uniref:Translation protein SH3-like domain n=1 Tax=Pseudocohnilembus persalinus TaxID=266149 RepID=A0A0V0QU00_PSEPJ|nr:Translation protein SH3-like domain [Pseudocohnilembus persalinus]|eukprot:KRX05732.1 Translation protein SH3-like domain [Pseudocohnilembus persalinus]